MNYDLLGRVVRTVAADGWIGTHRYQGLSTTDSNPVSETLVTLRNNIGQVASVTDALGSVTSYGYDAYGDLALVTDVAGNQTSYVYDKRGRKTQTTDPDLGIWHYVYDSLGHHWALGAWYARKDWIEKNPALVKNFVATLYATAKRVNAAPSSIDELLSAYSKVQLDRVRVTPKPIWAEKVERSSIEPQIQAAAAFNVISKDVSYRDMTGL